MLHCASGPAGFPANSKKNINIQLNMQDISAAALDWTGKNRSAGTG